ncbi:CotH kinase family protein [Candidatus Poribacteria bacterium]|nr:CotH kinase family protein [Candidatus Poribacteria bacterium]
MGNYRVISSLFIIVLVALLTSPYATHAQDKATETDLEALDIKLKETIASGEMTEEEALAEYEKAAGKMKGAKAGKDKGKDEKNWKAPAINGLPCSPDVSDGVDPTEGVSFDPNHIVCIKVTMDPHDFDRLASETRFDGAGNDFEQIWPDCSQPWPSTYNWYRADIEIDGVSLSEVGIRKKGFVGSQYSPVPALKIKTDKYVKDQFLGDTERITLNNNGGVIPRMAACLTYEVFAAAGYPAPRCNMANVMVNDQPKGPYVHIEAIKKRFLRRSFGDNTGSLYEGTHTDFVEAWLPRWECKTDDTDTSYAPLAGVAQALRKPDDELVDALSSVLNIDRYITFWALEALVNHLDGYGADRNNFYVYFDPNDADRAVFIPWGADKTFLSDFGLDRYLTADLPRRLSRIPTIAIRMEHELKRLLDEVWDEAALLESIDRYSAQVKSAQQDDDYDIKVEALRTWVRSHPDQVREMLHVGLPVGMEKSLPCTNERVK